MNRLKVLIVLLITASSVNTHSDDSTENPSAELLRWGDRQIHTDDLERYLLELPDEAVTNYLYDADNVRDGLLNIYKRQVIADAAVEAGIDDSRHYQQIMQSEREKTLVTLYREQYMQDLAIDNLESLAYEEYLAYPERYSEPERRDVSHILVMTSSSDTASTSGKESQKPPELLLDLQRQINAGNISFADAARQHSEDTGSKSAGGSLGLIEQGKTVPAFDQAVFAAEQSGMLAAPVLTRFGWHLIKVNDIQPQRQQSFEQVKETIMTSVEKRIKDERWIAHIDALGLEDGEPRIDKENLDDFIENYLQQRQTDDSQE